MNDIPYARDFAFQYEVVETVSPLVRRLVARNPGPFTAYGTGTYIVGRGDVAVIDPGPAMPAHVDALLKGLQGESINHLFITHTHNDHSPAAALVREATGAKTYGYGPHGTSGETSEEGFDRAFKPDVTLGDMDAVSGKGWTLRGIHTPGHTSNHMCFALEDERLLFPGDHVMGWSTTVISPPDGNMTDYMRSLEKLLEREDEAYFPTHGPKVGEPRRFVRALLGHRKARRTGILRELAHGERAIPEIVKVLYVGVDPRLHGAAARSVLAHLIELVEAGEVATDGAPQIGGRYRLAR